MAYTDMAIFKKKNLKTGLLASVTGISVGAIYYLPNTYLLHKVKNIVQFYT